MSKFFVARFGQVSESNDKFTPEATGDNIGQMPFIATVLAGKAKTGIINYSIAQSSGMLESVKTGKPFLCISQEREYEGNLVHDLVLVGEVSLAETIEYIRELGPGQMVLEETPAPPVSS